MAVPFAHPYTIAQQRAQVKRGGGINTQHGYFFLRGYQFAYKGIGQRAFAGAWRAGYTNDLRMFIDGQAGQELHITGHFIFNQ